MHIYDADFVMNNERYYTQKNGNKNSELKWLVTTDWPANQPTNQPSIHPNNHGNNQLHGAESL